MNIDETISLYGDSFKLHGIIYHHGIHLNTGHYTSSVDINGTWFTFDDSVVSNGVSLSCTNNDHTVPYIVMYKRTTQTNDNVIRDPVHFSVDDSLMLSESNSDTESTIYHSVVYNEQFSNNVVLPNPNAKQCQEKNAKSFANLCKVVETECQSQTFDTMSTTKQAVVKELFKQTDRIANAQVESSSTELLKKIKV